MAMDLPLLVEHIDSPVPVFTFLDQRTACSVLTMPQEKGLFQIWSDDGQMVLTDNDRVWGAVSIRSFFLLCAC